MGMKTFNISRKHPLGALLGASLIALLLVLSAANAFAQDSGSGEKAEAYYNKGVNAFFNKEYSLAITYFQRANALDPNPVVLYNISLAQSRLGNAAEALSASVKADEMEGLPADTLLKNKARMHGYRLIIRAEKLADAQAAKAIAQAEALKAEEAGAPEAELSEEDVFGGDAFDSQDMPDAGMGVLGWAGIGTAGVGVAALVASGVLSVMLSDDLDSYESARVAGEYDRARGLQDTINDRQSLGQIMLYSGAGLLALGGALWAVDYFGGSETKESGDTLSQPTLGGSVGASGASVQANWRF